MSNQSSLQDLVISTAKKYGIPTDLALAQVQQESGWNPNAVSGSGAQGLLQLMPATANELGVTNSFDPVQNVDAGFKYLSQQFQKFGDWSLALAAYNAGPGNVIKYGGIPPFSETQNYVDNIMSAVNTATIDNGSNGDLTLGLGLVIAAIGILVIAS